MSDEDDDKDPILALALELDLGVFPGPAMPRPCKDCPFVREEQGTGYLTEKRLKGIKTGVALGQPFWCHKSVYVKETDYDQKGEPADYAQHYRMCKGALDWVAAFRRRNTTPDKPKRRRK